MTDARRGKSHFWARGGPESDGDVADPNPPTGVGSASRLQRPIGSRMARVLRGGRLRPMRVEARLPAAPRAFPSGAEFPSDPWGTDPQALLFPQVV